MFSNKIQNLDDLFAEDDAKALETARKEIAQENAAWEALPQNEKDRVNAERQQKLEKFFETNEAEDDLLEDDEDEDDEE